MKKKKEDTANFFLEVDKMHFFQKSIVTKKILAFLHRLGRVLLVLNRHHGIARISIIIITIHIIFNMFIIGRSRGIAIHLWRNDCKKKKK